MFEQNNDDQYYAQQEQHWRAMMDACTPTRTQRLCQLIKSAFSWNWLGIIPLALAILDKLYSQR